MKKVLILNHGLHISGVSRTLVNFANSLVNHGYDVTLKIEINDFTLKSELDDRIKCSLFIKEPSFFGFRVKGFLRFYSIFMKILLKLPAKLQYKLIVNEKFDTEIAFNRGAAANIISASTNKSSKKLVWVHSDYSKNKNPLAGFKNLEHAKSGYKNFDHVVCVSEQAQKAFEEKFGTGCNLVTKYNIMDVWGIKRKAEEEFISKKGFVICAVGRLSEEKNYIMLLHSYKALKDKNSDITLWIVGDGSLRNDLETEIQRLNLKDVVLWGAKENPYPYLKCADLYVSSSIYEGLSTTTIEALILGKPIIATNCTGMEDILGKSKFGIIVPIDESELTKSISKMMENKELREYYSLQAQIRAKDFDPELAFKRIEELL